jgi:hypothetical protein
VPVEALAATLAGVATPQELPQAARKAEFSLLPLAHWTFRSIDERGKQAYQESQCEGSPKGFKK